MPDEAQLSDREVREYLADRGVTPAQAERIVNDYHVGFLAIDYGNTYEWLDTQAERYTQGGTYPDRAITIGARQADQASDENERSFAAVQELAREAAARRRQNQRDAFNRGASIDSGPAMDPDVIANTVALGAWTDAEGNFVDPLTGQRLPEGTPPIPADANAVWEQIKGQRFNMGALAIPGAPRTFDPVTQAGQTRPPGWREQRILHASADAMERNPRQRGETRVVPAGVEPVRARRFVTPSQALSLLSSMSEDYLSQLQLQMWEAGLFPEDTRPTWGRADEATRLAFQSLFIKASMQPGKNIAAVLADLGLNRRESSPPPPGSPGAGGIVLPDFTPTVANPERMRQDIDELAQETLGRFLPPEQRDALVSRLAEREVSLQRTQYEQDVARARLESPGQGLAAPNDIDAFMAALAAQESGGSYTPTSSAGAYGKYQIMPANWPEWSRRAGLPPGSRQTPENQEIVARQIVSEYFAQFGNWRDVAVAWYSGPGNIASKRYSDRAQRGGPSINDYAESVMGRMAGYRRTGTGQTGMGATGAGMLGGAIYPPTEEFDPMAEAEAALRAADPAGWQATEFASRATEFFGALGSVLGGR